jgi:hypothetical protein
MLRGGDAHGEGELVITWPGHRALLIALTTHCGSCDEIVEALPEIRLDNPDLPIILAFVATATEARAYVMAHRIPSDITALAHTAFRRVLRVRATPYAFVVNPDGSIKARGITNTADHVTNLLHGTSLDGLPRRTSEIVEEAIR